MKAKIFSGMSALAAAKANQITSLVEQDCERVALVASRNRLREYLLEISLGKPGTEKNRFRMKKILLDALQSVGSFKQLAAMDVNGKVIASTRQEDVGQDFSRGFKQTERLQGFFLSDFFLDDEQLMYEITAPMVNPFNKKHEIIGYLLGRIDLSNLIEILKDHTGLGQSGETLLGTAREQEMVFVAPPRLLPKGALALHVGRKGPLALPLQKALAGETTVLVGPDYRGVDVLAACRFLPIVNWGLVAKIDVDEAFSTVHQLSTQISMISLIILLVTIIIMGLAITSLTRPLAVIQKGIQIIRKGALEHRIPVTTRDELGQLSLAFNDLLDHIQKMTASRQELDREIEERKQAEEALQISETRLRDILGSTSDWIWEVDEQGRYTFCSDGIMKVLGYQPDEVLGRTIYELIPTEERKLAGNLVRDILARKAPIIELENWNLAKDGRKICLVINGVPILDDQGRLLGYRGADRDITVQKQLESEIQERTTKLEHSNRELQQFAYIASHDLQEPLRKITAFGDRLVSHASEALDEKSRDYLDRMQSAAGRMKQLIEDLLNYSRVTTQANLFTDVSLEELIKEALGMLEVRVAETGGEVNIERKLPTVNGDRSQLQQLIQNLLSNALKYHQQDLPPKIIISGRELADDLVEVTVTDNGIGFDEKYLDRIFLPFQRLHSRQEYDGTGIGLAISQKIVHRHGGTITARSRFGTGSSFIITLPMAGKA